MCLVKQIHSQIVKRIGEACIWKTLEVFVNYEGVLIKANRSIKRLAFLCCATGKLWIFYLKEIYWWCERGKMLTCVWDIATELAVGAEFHHYAYVSTHPMYERQSAVCQAFPLGKSGTAEQNLVGGGFPAPWEAKRLPCNKTR